MLLPTLVAYRDVRERVSRLAPFFAIGSSVDAVVLRDSLYWTVDLYSMSEWYPLSKHYAFGGADASYLRHAAVAVVQASTGEVVVVTDSLLDPIASNWLRRLPSLFGTWSSLPAGIRARLAPRRDLVRVQA